MAVKIVRKKQPAAPDYPTFENATLPEKIRQRRSQMLVHSCLYYHMDDNLVSDHVWQAWADELAELQTRYPEACQIGFYDKEFMGWNGSTGCHLPTDHEVLHKARKLQEYHYAQSA